MKSMRTVLLAVFAVATAPGSGRADPLNHSLAVGEQLRQTCASDATTLRAMCLGYLAAVADDLDLHGKGRTRPACVPGLVNLDAYRLAALAYLQANPDAASQPSFELVKRAIVARWPCP